MGKFRNWLRAWLADAPAPVTVAPPAEMKLNPLAEAEARYGGREALHPWRLPARPDFAPDAEAMAVTSATMALDGAPGYTGMTVGSLYAWMAGGALSEGIGFLGYAYLAELSQRPEYRHVSEIYASEATRKGVKFHGDPERIASIEASMKRLGVWPTLRHSVELDGFMGRGQIYIDVGDDVNSPAGITELAKPFVAKAKVKPGGLKGFRTVEPFWSYPGQYESAMPLHPDFYRPKCWYVMNAIVDDSRLYTIVSRPLPDMLKPAYSFGGLSLSQMVKPYVDNWLRTRQSVSDLVHSFSTMILATNMQSVLSGGPTVNLFRRLAVASNTRDNRGWMAIDKETEEITNVTTPLGTLDKLLAQSQEQIASVSKIPLVILLGVTPSGLNASSDGEVRTFYASMKSYQERVLRPVLDNMVGLIQMDLDGKIDPEITFDFIDLWEMDEKDKAAIRKSDGELDVGYVAAGIVSADEVRERITNDEDSPYFGMDLSAPAPEPPEKPGNVDDGDDDENTPPQKDDKPVDKL